MPRTETPSWRLFSHRRHPHRARRDRAPAQSAGQALDDWASSPVTGQSHRRGPALLGPIGQTRPRTPRWAAICSGVWMVNILCSTFRTRPRGCWRSGVSLALAARPSPGATTAAGRWMSRHMRRRGCVSSRPAIAVRLTPLLPTPSRRSPTGSPGRATQRRAP